MKTKDPCPCTSGKSYGDCCAPFHRGEREPDDAPTLVRARYAAFALGEIEFLWRTLHDDHPDRVKHGREKTLSTLRIASGALKYMGLSLLDARASDEHGFSQVLYLARIFKKGTNVSFIELADFFHDGKGHRYRSGKTLDASMDDPTHLTIELFAARATA